MKVANNTQEMVQLIIDRGLLLSTILAIGEHVYLF